MPRSRHDRSTEEVPARRMVDVTAANTILYCGRFEDCVAFYADSLGFELIEKGDWFVEFRICESACLSLADETRTSIAGGRGRGVTLTFRVADADSTQAVLSARGVETTPVKTTWGARTFFVFDPDGHRLEFWSSSKA